MKFLILAALLITTHAMAFISESEELAIVENIAKTERRNMWQNGYEDVDSGVSKPEKSQLDEIIKMNREFENPLSKQEISSLYQCFHIQSCALFLIDVSASMYGGYGNHYLWVLLSTQTGKYRFIRHQVYAE